ncbi:multidrug efflux SMR transporter [Catellatospora sp. KI3]|uniref:DMT family transporter n=1 Tax=Catellatospora sp. KI3 TaxID=3041620 RepID=UPI002482F8E8|nr:multidrug efflux SMR transporter [Catellatospora sp. KI3]MDI1465246.1 multidrug efflux SMR transporter [Catellatospora sp. KI3]
MAYLMLAGAILAEVAATVCLRASAGFTRLVPSIVVVVGYLTAFALPSQVLKRGMALGLAYGVWAGIGVALVAIAGVVFFHDKFTWIQIAGLILVAAGVAALELGQSH